MFSDRLQLELLAVALNICIALNLEEINRLDLHFTRVHNSILNHCIGILPHGTFMY